MALLNMVIASALSGVFSPLSVVSVLLMLITLTLAAISPTGRWIAARHQPQLPHPYAPAPTYGQPPNPYQPPAPGYQPPASPSGQSPYPY
jgi:hypothetical protein